MQIFICEYNGNKMNTINSYNEHNTIMEIKLKIRLIFVHQSIEKCLYSILTIKKVELE